MNVLDMVRRHGIKPRKAASTKGGEYHSPCPGCAGRDRFHVWPEENPDKEVAGAYWCRQCGKAGDAIQFLRDFEGMTFHQACETIGRDVPDTRMRPRPARKQIWDPEDRENPEGLIEPNLWREKAGKFVSWAYERLFDHPEVENYLAARGISMETAGRFGLGWCSGDGNGDLYRDRESWGLSKLISDKGKLRVLWLPVGLMIPCFSDETVSRIRIRRPGDPSTQPAGKLRFGPRYYVVPGSIMKTMVIEEPQGARCERRPDIFVVVEAELDGIMIAEQAGDICGVVALGSSGTKPDRAAVEVLKESVCILNALDFDKAGAEARHWWKREFPDCERWPVPKGKDPGEAFQAGVDIREWIRAGLPEGIR